MRTLLLLCGLLGAACGPSLVLCSSDTCMGCCDGNRCLNGTADMWCGAGGKACSACASGSTCVKQACSTGARTCSPANCDGCCDGSGQCVSGQLATACGSLGQACGVCFSNELCQPTGSGAAGGACR